MMNKLKEKYFSPVPPAVKRLLLIIKAAGAAAATSAYVNDNPELGMLILAGIGAINEVLQLTE